MTKRHARAQGAKGAQGKGQSKGKGKGPSRRSPQRREARFGADPRPADRATPDDTAATVGGVGGADAVDAVDGVDATRTDRLEGPHAIEEALRAGRVPDKIWVLQDADGRVPQDLYRLAEAAREQGAVISRVPRASLDRMTVTGNPQGIIAQIPAVAYRSVASMLADAEAKGEAPFLILLDQIQDAHNLGAILRVADGAGAHGVIIPKHRAVGVDAVAVRASAGASNHVAVARVTNLSQCMRELKEKNIWIAGADERGEDALMTKALRGPIALVIGHEGDGLSQHVKETCDFLVSIPMYGHVSSLNASVACGILAYRIRQLREM